MFTARSYNRVAIGVALAVYTAGSAVAAESRGEPPSPPDFRRHVMPLLTKLGCNKAACHGASEGQGGFALSLFGYDWKADHTALLGGDPDLRANWRNPDASLIVRKPSGLEAHDGGILFEPNGFEYEVLIGWVKDRARGVPLGADWLEVTQLEVEPREILARPADQPLQFRVRAHWNNGTSEDVTPFCRFECKDESIATVTPGGRVDLHQPGMTHVLIYYDRAIQPAEIVVPFASPDQLAASPTPGSGPVDAAVNRQLARLGLRPAGLCSDVEFLRRVRLDMTGQLPLPDEVIEFANDTAADKRARKVDELLASDRYADHWAAWLCELFGLNEAVMPDAAFARQQAALSYYWVRQRVKDDESYAEIVNRLVRSLGRRRGQSFADYTAEMNAAIRDDGGTALAGEERLPFFWSRKHIREASDKALTFSHTFLAVKLQCAECHKHPFDRWTKEDFEGLEAFFEPMKFGTPQVDQPEVQQLRASLRAEAGRINDGVLRRALKADKTIPFSELFFTGEAKAAPVDRLETLSEWMSGREHPYMAVAIVNRVWESYFGTGIVNTPDDLSVGNPPVNRELLDRLVLGFIESGYRLSWLHREIVLSQAYQRSSAVENAVPEHRRQFAQTQYRSLPAEALYDAVLLATCDDPARIGKDDWMVGLRSVLRNSNPQRQWLARLGQPLGREVCARVRSNDPTLPRTLELYNGPVVRELIDRPTGWIAGLRDDVAQQSSTATLNLQELVTEAYLRTLSRWPTESERERCVSYCRESDNRIDALRDVLWALINTREFLLNH